MGGRRGELPRVPPRPLNGSADTAQCALDILSLDVWQNCAFTSLLGYREVCALACCSKALLALMTNELIWRELFLASKNTPALTTITNWREAFKQRCALRPRRLTRAAPRPPRCPDLPPHLLALAARFHRAAR